MKPRRENPETALQRAALNLIHDHGISAWRMNTGMAVGLSQLKRANVKFDELRPTRYGIPGVPDIIGWIARHTASGLIAQWIGVECKVNGRTLTYDQWMFLNDLKTAGGIAITLYDDCDGLIEAIRDGRSSNLGKCPPKPVKRARVGKSDKRQLTFARATA